MNGALWLFSALLSLAALVALSAYATRPAVRLTTRARLLLLRTTIALTALLVSVPAVVAIGSGETAWMTAGTVLLACISWQLKAVYPKLRQFFSGPSRQTLETLNDKLIAEMVDRREIERELAHMASFSEMAPNPIIEMDGDETIRYINPAALVDFPDLQTQQSKHPVFEGLAEVLTLLRREERTLLTRPIKIGDRIYDQQIALLDGGPRVRLYFRDITELKRLDQLKTDFVNMVSHELRSPLTTIQASVRMVAEKMLGPVSEDQRDALHMASRNLDRLARLINELLDISQIEAGKLELHCEPVEMTTLMQELARQFEPLARERGLTFTTRNSVDKLDAFVDRDKIIQIVTNLVQNALKFTERGSVEIRLEQDGSEMRCTVADTGPGIRTEDLPKVFGKFQQFGQPSKSREKGTGLGLSLCKGIVELHGGRIWVESDYGKGTRFIFQIPLVNPEDIFAERLHTLFEEAVTRKRPLTLIRMDVTPCKTASASELSDDVLRQLTRVVRSAVGTESIVTVHRHGGILLALPEIAKESARLLADKIVCELQSHLTPESATGLRMKMAAYPDDGTAAEQLLQSLKSAA